MVTKRPSLCHQGWFSFNVAPNPNSPSTLLERHVRATLHKHRRHPWWEAALSVASTVRFGDPKNVQTHRGSTANLSKNMQKYLKRIHVPYPTKMHAFDLHLHLGCSCAASNLRGLGLLDTAFKRRRPRWKRAKSGSWRFTRLPTKSQQVGSKTIQVLNELFDSSMINVWKNRWIHECIDFNSMNADAYLKCTNKEFKSKNENQWKFCHIWITIAESMGFVFVDGAVIWFL